MAKTRVVLDDAKLREIIRDVAGQDVSTWVVADGVEYGIYHEMGTSRASANPQLVPAFENRVKTLGRALGQGIERAMPLNPIVGKVAFDIQRDYQQGVHVRTSALKNSIHVEEQ